jgi:Flp pilus assembly protein protease CpaA
MLIAAVVNARTYEYRVPNLLSFPAIVSGWLVALAISASIEIPSRGGGLVPSVAGSAVGFFLLIPFYKGGWLGAGCVKMQMAFGAWVGCAVGLPAAVLVTGLATVAGGLITAIGAAYLVLRLRSQEEVIVWSHLFPAQITLSLGSVWGVAGAVLMGWV